jgi:hypothetical protein
MPTKGKKLQALERVVAVLNAIQAGADYWFKPYAVNMRFTHWSECTGFPTYSVHINGSPRMTICGPSNLWDEDMTISIKGIVQDNYDTTTKILKCIQDIRRAVDADSMSGVAGTLGTLAVECVPDEGFETDDGYLSMEGFGFFDQKYRIKVSGEPAEL